MWAKNKNLKCSKHTETSRLLLGALQGIRTPDLLVRSQTLYPAELAAHIFLCPIILSLFQQKVNRILKILCNKNNLFFCFFMLYYIRLKL